MHLEYILKEPTGLDDGLVGYVTTIVARATRLSEQAFTVMRNTRRETAFGKTVYIVKHFH